MELYRFYKKSQNILTMNFICLLNYIIIILNNILLNKILNLLSKNNFYNIKLVSLILYIFEIMF